MESGSTGEVETKVQKTERNEDVDADCSKESSIGRDSKRSASEVGLSQEDNSNTKLFRGTRPIVKAIQNSRIRWKTRQSTADVLFNKLVKKGLSEEEACERAMREEEDIYQSCGNEGEIVYTNTASHRFRKLFKTTFGDMR